ncbi:hypothetical protein AB1Y20_010372 [Prymnesium parvum]|uniref:CS domain-containing protein n=1 Tax=Prymnesium parvum TaxID=97485 RepID=A0AB34IR55_PRYPA
MLEDREIYELRQLCTTGGLSQDSLGALIDAGLSVPTLVRSEAAAMAATKKAGLGLADRQKLREALRKHKDDVLSAEQPRILEIGDDAEAYHIVAAQHHMAEARAKARAHGAEEAKGVEVVKNGNICAGYRWTQELTELTVSIELPPGTTKRDVVCKFSMQNFTAGLRGHPPIVEGALFSKIKVDDCMWQLQDSHKLIVTLQKLIVSSEEQRWWPCLIQGEPEIDTSKCESGASTNLMVSEGQRISIQKIELPELKDGEKRKYSPEAAEKAWRDFFKKFPDMHAWEITFNANSEKSMEEQLVETLEKSLAKDKGEWERGTS